MLRQIQLSFTYDHISILLKRPLLKTQKQLQTRWISRFRRIVEYFDPAQHSIKKDVDFIIERASSFDYIPKRGEKSHLY
jgi:hypothetical protein